MLEIKTIHLEGWFFCDNRPYHRDKPKLSRVIVTARIQSQIDIESFCHSVTAFRDRKFSSIDDTWLDRPKILSQ
jgi:hypothetical protein